MVAGSLQVLRVRRPMTSLPFRPSGAFSWGPDPELPKVDRGDMYWSETVILHCEPEDPDVKPRRPVVVVRPPTPRYPKVVVIVRTTDTECKGVDHPADATLGLDPGVWILPEKWAHHHQFAGPGVDLIGPLGDPYFTQVVDMVRQGRPPS